MNSDNGYPSLARIRLMLEQLNGGRQVIFFVYAWRTRLISTPDQAKLDLKTMFQDMSEEDRNRILGIKTAPDIGKKKQLAKNDVDKHKSNPTVHANTQDDAPATIAELEVCYIANPLGARAD